MRVEKFKAEDYYALNVEDSPLSLWVSPERINDVLMAWEFNGISRSVWVGDKLYAIYGMVELRLGVSEVFFMPSKQWTEKKIAICKAIKKDLKGLIRMYKRIQMTCLEDCEFLRFSKFFGFEKEGSLKCYDKLGRTYSILAITGGVL